MSKFIIELDGGDNLQYLIEVDGTQSMGCSGGVTTELLISGATVQSVLDGVVYCVPCTDSGVVVPTNSR